MVRSSYLTFFFFNYFEGRREIKDKGGKWNSSTSLHGFWGATPNPRVSGKKYVISPYPTSGLFDSGFSFKDVASPTHFLHGQTQTVSLLFPALSDLFTSRIIETLERWNPYWFISLTNLTQNWLMHDCHSLVIEFIQFMAAFQDQDNKPASE